MLRTDMSASDPSVESSFAASVATAASGAFDLDVYGLRLRIDGDWPEIVEDLRRDFAWFVRGSDGVAPHVVVSIARRAPDPGRFDAVPQSFITTRNAVFQSGAQTIVDYFGRAMATYDRARDELLVESEDKDLVHEAAYLFLLSRIGRHLDSSRLMRIHALGLSGRQGAVLVLLPSGGGKTTLALSALRKNGVKLLSEDTPVLDRRGFVHPFPLRIGVNVTDAHLLPDGQVRRIERLEYGPKLLLSMDTVEDRIERAPQPLRHLVLGRRWLSGGGSLTPIPRRSLIGPLVRDGVVGVGVAQMIEYVLRQGPRDLLGQGGIAAGRARCCARALVGTSAWQLELGRDPTRNWNALAQLLQ
jgi:hypothetical protein